MKGVEILFKNILQADGSLKNVLVENCLVAPNGTATANRPQIIIHLPKTFTDSVHSAWLEYAGDTYHVVNKTNSGATAPMLRENSPTEWNRYCIAERIY